MRPTQRRRQPRQNFTINDRPVWHGLPVPWVARWTGEIRKEPIRAALYNQQLWLTFTDLAAHPSGPQHAIDAERDSLGLLWLPDLDAPGTGKPEFAGLHTKRYRASMLDHICQVCGTPFPAGEPVTFLESSAIRDKTETRNPRADDNQPYVTSTPPTCRTCVPAVMRLCPHNQDKDADRIIVSTRGYEPVAAIGDLYEITRAVVTLREPRAVIPLNNPRISRTITKQLYVRISNYTTEPVPASSTRPS